MNMIIEILAIWNSFIRKNSLSILKKVYKELEKAELYREYSRQILSYHEYFRGNEKLASGSYNDKTEDGYLTNLTVLQMPEKMISEKKIEQHIEKGRYFTLKEYQRPLNQEIPLIAGYDYQKVFHLNQKIKYDIIKRLYVSQDGS